MVPESGNFYLGGVIEPGSGQRTGDPLVVPSHHLTTHGVILGMTGSGKTGLGVVLLEEALLSGIPALILDPKGDMGNLLLNFPGLTPEEFRPWVDPAEARRQGVGVDELAAKTSATWREGLSDWGIDHGRVGALRQAADFAVYTPGSTAGIPLSLIGSLSAPDIDWEANAETLRDEIEGFVSGILQLANVHADPVSGPEHILLSNLIEHAWAEGRDLDLGSLIGLILHPPIRKLGVFSLDDFFPEAKRNELAMRLNGLVASKSFSSWVDGNPLDIESLLQGSGGRPRASIVHLAHLSDSERQFVVTLILTRFITWMRQQPGTSELRALIYMDEMFGFAPPTAEPPSKKPILTLFKQARAHGVGLVVATQNPVDLDYKAMSNAGTWMVGRLQTERDKLRVLEGLKSASGDIDVPHFDKMIGGLDKRQFVVRSARSAEPRLFASRWAMSFLRGTLTREELIRLKPQMSPGFAGPEKALEVAEPQEKLRSDESLVAPVVPDSIRVHYLDASAPWARDVGSAPGAHRLEPALVTRVNMTFDDQAAGVDHREEWEAVFFPIEERLEPEAAISVDYDDRDFRREAPDNAVYALSSAPISRQGFFRDAASVLKEHLYRERDLEILKNPALKLYSRVGESEADFRARCDRAAGEWADSQTAGLKSRFEPKIERVRDALATAERRVRELEADVGARKQQEVVAGAGRILSMFLAGKANTRSLSGFASRRSMTTRTQERLKSASERVSDKEAAIDDLEDQLAEELSRIQSEADDRAEQIEPLEVGLEKTDISVSEMALLWIPVPPRDG